MAIAKLAMIVRGDAYDKLLTAALTAGALLAFAGNSLICRLRGTDRTSAASGKHARGGMLLFLYAVTFAYAYQSLSAGTGALILFAAVQLTMIGAALASGERLSLLQWCGWWLAMAGLFYLVFPGIAAPSLGGSLLMIAAGAAWGGYSLSGRGVANPMIATEENFLRAVPWALACVLFNWSQLVASPIGIVWALLSGAVTSGVGYVLWYGALARLTTTRAATVQLAVPVIAGFGGVVMLSEPVTARLVIAGVGIIGGIALALSGRQIASAKGAQPLPELRLAPGCEGGRR